MRRATQVLRAGSRSTRCYATAPRHLATGQSVGMRIWENEQPNDKGQEPSTRPYETVGYVISGRAELHLEGKSQLLGPKSSWVVPKGQKHHYKILESFTAVEATSPPDRNTNN